MAKDTIESLMELRGNLKQTLIELKKKNEDALKDIENFKTEKAEILKGINEKKNEVKRLEYNASDMSLELDEYLERIDYINRRSMNLEKNIDDKVKMVEFSQESMDLKQTFISTMNFYSKDSLRSELTKRNNKIREKRVELTNLEKEYKDLQRKIEERKRKKEEPAPIVKVPTPVEQQAPVQPFLEKDNSESPKIDESPKHIYESTSLSQFLSW